MKQLITKSERHSFYKKALKISKERIKAKRDFGVCLILDDLWGGDWHDLLKAFPEFAKKKPKKPFSNMWWPLNDKGNKNRIATLEKCIKETAPN
jgi:uncharacterized protein HemY